MSRPSSDGPRLSLAQATLLGAIHGPAELLPVSSSAHVSLVPWLLGWDYTRLDTDLRKSFEVAVHAGTAAGLMLALRGEVGQALRGLDRRSVLLGAISVAPAAVVGLLLDRPIEDHLGTPPTIAAGLLAGGLAMALADRAPEVRHAEQAGTRDSLWIGVAQACALFPGVSRSGATLAAARALRFTRTAAGRLSRQAALPVIAGATALKGVQLYRRSPRAATAAPLAAGATAAFASTLAAARLMRPAQRDGSMLPPAAYRAALALTVLSRRRAIRRGSTAGRSRRARP